MIRAKAGVLVALLCAGAAAKAQAGPSLVRQTASTAVETKHPALFLVGDSIVHTGTGDGSTGPWGWGSEIGSFFNPERLHVYNEGLGGRSSRGYREEGAWAQLLQRVKEGDWVMLQFGHNDAQNSANYPDRTTLKGDGDDTAEVQSPVTHFPETLHSYGWYLRQDVAEAKSRGANVIILSPPPRNQWLEGKVMRGLDGYASWAADAARVSGARFIDLNTISADKYDALGQDAAAAYFNDVQHSRKKGARLNAESVVSGLRGLKGCPLADDLASSPQ